MEDTDKRFYKNYILIIINFIYIYFLYNKLYTHSTVNT